MENFNKDEKQFGGRVKEFVGNIGTTIKDCYNNLDMEDALGKVGRFAGYLAPSAVAFAIDPKLGIATIIPSVTSAIAIEIDNAIHGNRVDATIKSGLLTGIASGAIAAASTNADADIHRFGLWGAGSAIVSSACSELGHHAGSAVGRFFENTKDDEK